MKLLTMFAWRRSESQAERLNRLFIASGEWLNNNNKIHTTLEWHKALCMIGIEGRLPAFSLKNDGDRVITKVADVLADYILEEEEPRLLRTIIRDDYHYGLEEEELILDYCKQMLYTADKMEEDPSQQAAQSIRKKLIIEELKEYLSTQTELHLDGFIRFRLRSYKKELHDVVEYAIDEYVMDRQYQEFISLLQYFVYIQEAKVPFVHLIHKGGNEFLLLNENMEVMDTDDPDSVVTMELLEKNMNFEDMVVSTLITVSPQTIYIHTREPEQQVIKTISQIFENRVELCRYCRLCQNLDRFNTAEYNNI